MPGVAIGILFYGVGLGISWLVHTTRRLRGVYRRGYALVAQDAEVGAEIRPEHPFQMTSSPVFLPPGVGLLPVAIVRDAKGVRASFRDQGLVWTATSAQIEQILPSWTGFGPNGYVVLDVMHLATSAPLDRINAATAPNVSNMHLIRDEPRRSWLLNAASEMTDWIAYQRIRAEVLGDPPREIPDEDLAREIEGRQGPGWLATRRISTVAALAASEIGTLPDRHFQEWTAPWVALTKPRDWILPAPTIRNRARRKLGAVTDFIARWPSLLAVLTFVLILVVFSINSVVGLVASVLGVGGLTLALVRRPPRPGRWRPHATTLDEPVSADRLRQAMAGLRRTSNPLYQLWLHHLFARTHIWVAVDAVKPTHPDRWLAWLESNRQEVPLQTLAMPDGGRAALAFTAPAEHWSAERSLHVQWTIQLDWEQTVRFARAAHCSALFLDTGRTWGIEVTIG